MRCSLWSLLCHLILIPSVPVSAPAEESAAGTAPIRAESAEQAILKKLQTPLTLQFEKTPLKDALATVAEKAGVPFVLDVTALKEEELSAETPLTDQFANVTGESVLTLLLKPLGLTWIVRNEVLMVTTEVAAGDVEQYGCLRVYDVTSLLKHKPQPSTLPRYWGPQWLPPPKEQKPPIIPSYSPPPPLDPFWKTSPAWLSEAIQISTGGPPVGPWLDVDGDGGTLKLIGNSLIIRQSWHCQFELQSLLTEMEAAQAREPSHEPIPVGSRPGYPLEADQQLQAALKKSARYEFQKTPLTEAIRTIEQKLGYPVRVDLPALAEEGISPEVPVSLQAQDISQQSALRLMLEPLDLSAVVREGRLFITSDTGAVDLQNYGNVVIYNLGHLSPAVLDDLVQAIQSTTGGPPHGPWLDVDGDGGTISVCPKGILVIRQTQKAHEEIAVLISEYCQRFAQQARPPATHLQQSADQPGLIIRHYHFQEKQFCRQVQKALPMLVAPESWGKNSGATIQQLEATLVIRQTPEVHRQIVAWLTEMTREMYADQPRAYGGFGIFSIPDASPSNDLP